MIEEGDDDPGRLNAEFSKFSRFKNLVEECYLKDKLVFKRALILCKSLLKQCGVRVHRLDHNPGQECLRVVCSRFQINFR